MAPRAARKPRAPRASATTKPTSEPQATAVAEPERTHVQPNQQGINDLISAGWQPSEDGSLWFHARKSRGEFFDFERAVDREREASAPIPDPIPEVDPSLLGVNVASPEAQFSEEVLGLPNENPLVLRRDGDGRDVNAHPAVPDAGNFQEQAAPPTAPPASSSGYAPEHRPAMTAEQMARQADADARAAAIERNEQAVEFAHDQVGNVVFWSCYKCGVQVRYAAYCLCGRCKAINASQNGDGHCPFCLAKMPHTEA